MYVPPSTCYKKAADRQEDIFDHVVVDVVDGTLDCDTGSSMSSLLYIQNRCDDDT